MLIALGTIGLYTFLHWLFFIKMELFPMDEEVLNFFVPMALPWVPIIIWIRPRIKLLNLKNTKGKDPLMGYMFLIWLIMIVPSVIAQEYIITATGTLTPLTQISQINLLPKTKFYSVKKYYVDKRMVRVKTTFTVSGKYNENFDIAIYSPCPIFDRDASELPPRVKFIPASSDTSKPLILLDGKIIAADSATKLSANQIASVNIIKGYAATALYGDGGRHGVIIMTTKNSAIKRKWQPSPNANDTITPVAWIALKYQKTISNRLSGEEKETEYKAFAKETELAFDSTNVGNFVYLDKIGQGKDLKNYKLAINSNRIRNLSGPIIVLAPVKEAFAARNGKKLPWIFGSLAIGAIIFMVTLLFVPMRDDYAIGAQIQEESVGERSSLDEIKQYFFPREGYYITPVIIDINLLVFIIMCFAGLGFISFDGPDLLKWGANYRPLVNDGEYWRLLTNIFLHGGLIHILFNMYGLLFVGLFLEPVIGKGKYAAAYLGTGIVASIASAWWHPATVSVGASGAIFGMYGIFLALLTTNFFPNGFKKTFLINTLIFVGYNLLFGLTGGIDNAAHIGGLLSGLIIGYILYPSLKRRSDEIGAEDNEHFSSGEQHEDTGENGR